MEKIDNSKKTEPTIKIRTSKGSIDVYEPEILVLRQIQNLLTYGVMPFDETVNGADFGIVMDCGGKEVYCLKLQPVEVERSQAEDILELQHLMIVEAYSRYIKMGFRGAYLAAPYIRQRDNGLWEAGVSHFIFPHKKDTNFLGKLFTKGYDKQFGNGATNMFNGFIKCYKKAFNEANLTMPQYFGVDIRTRSHLQSLAMNFMVMDSRFFCLRANLREEEDIAWAILASGGINNVYHLPSIPLAIPESDLGFAKGLL